MPYRDTIEIVIDEICSRSLDEPVVTSPKTISSAA